MTQDNSKSSGMKASFKKALKVFKYLFMVFAVVYWIGVVIDDWEFIQNYWATNWLMYLGIWTSYFAIYAVVLALYYWAITGLTILFYHKVIQPMLGKRGDNED